MGPPTPPTTIGTDDRSAPPAPRRIRLDATGWALLREAAEAAGMAIERLPETDHRSEARSEVRAALMADDVLSDDGRLSRTVQGAMAVLTTAPVTVTVEHVTADRASQGLWRTLGLPSAGVVIRDAVIDGQASREVELQVLAGDDLLDLVMAELVTDAQAERPTDDRGSFEVDAGDLTGLPDGVVVDGDLVARAAVTVSGPASSTVAQLVGDGRRWWQVGASGPDRLRWVPVAATQIRASLISAVTTQLADENGRRDV